VRITGHAVASGPVISLRADHDYGYRGSKPLEDDPVPSARAGAIARTAGRIERRARFKAILAAQGYPDPSVRIPPSVIIKAGEQVGVTAKTARKYRTELVQQRREEAQAS
jgi:hypothetical protein